MKRAISLILSIVLTILCFTPTFAAGNPTDDLYTQSGEILKNVGVLQGSSTGDLMLDKILTRQDMVVLISRLFKEEYIARNYAGKNNFTDINNSYYKPYISWAVNKGLIVGNGPKTFGFGQSVKVQQFQTLLLRALGYEEEAKDWNNVPTLAEALGIMENLKAMNNQEVSRGLMAAMTVNALRQHKKGSTQTLAQSLNITIPDPFTVTAVPTVIGDTLKLEGIATGVKSLKVKIEPLSSDNAFKEKSIDITLKSDGRFSQQITGLPSGNYKYCFISGNYSTPYENITIKEKPFEFSEVEATNLKEISLIFNKSVDKSTSQYISNYSTDAGKIKKVTISEDGTKVTLTLDDSAIMKNQKNYKVSVYKIKSSKGEELTLKNEIFTASDSEFPRVVEIKQLGNKALKVYFSEPIKTARSINFRLDDKNFVGSVTTENNIVTLNYQSSHNALKEGEHVLTSLNIQDYAGYKSVEENTSFEIMTDKEPPEIVSIRATLEEAVITFSEDIDPKTATKNNFYWKSASLKRNPTNVEVSGNEVTLDFSTKNLPNYEVTIYAQNVADYSGNKISTEEINVTPIIDKTRPEVISVEASEDGKSITVYFSKNVTGNVRTAYTIKNENGRNVTIRDISGSGRKYTLNLYGPLPIGYNTISIEGIYDATAVKNLLIPYSTKIEMKDTMKPKIINYSGINRQIILQFSKRMDPNTLNNTRNYLITFNGSATFLPEYTEFTTLNDDQTLIILLPSEINGKPVNIGTSGNITGLQIMGLRDVSGNYLDPEVTTISFNSTTTGKARAKDYYNNIAGKEGILEESDTVKIRFTQPIVAASPYDFNIIGGREIYDVLVDGTDVITLILDDNEETTAPASLINIKVNNEMETIIGTGVEAGTIRILDKVPPRIKDDTSSLTVSGRTIELPFSEPLEGQGESLYKRDLEVIRLYDGYVLGENEYSTSLKPGDSSKLIISIGNPRVTSSYTIRVKGNPQYIRDKDGNIVSESADYYTDRDIIGY